MLPRTQAGLSCHPKLPMAQRSSRSQKIIFNMRGAPSVLPIARNEVSGFMGTESGVGVRVDGSGLFLYRLRGRAELVTADVGQAASHAPSAVVKDVLALGVVGDLRRDDDERCLEVLAEDLLGTGGGFELGVGESHVRVKLRCPWCGVKGGN